MVSLPSDLDAEVAALIAEETSYAGRGCVPGKAPGGGSPGWSPTGAYRVEPLSP